jgi:hypothetical protein
MASALTLPRSYNWRFELRLYHLYLLPKKNMPDPAISYERDELPVSLNSQELNNLASMLDRSNSAQVYGTDVLALPCKEFWAVMHADRRHSKFIVRRESY